MQTQGIVPMILPVHILAGMLALVFGYVALLCDEGRDAASQERNALRLRDGRDVAQSAR